MADTPLYVGIDLGTTNSAAAVFDGERVSVVRNAQGATVTPSVVRLDKQGRVTVGTRARRFLEQDPTNTAAEFKRLMGTGKPIEFPAAAVGVEEKEILGSYSAAVDRADEAARLIFTHQLPVKELISHRFSLEDMDRALQLAARPEGNSLKVVIHP